MGSSLTLRWRRTRRKSRCRCLCALKVPMRRRCRALSSSNGSHPTRTIWVQRGPMPSRRSRDSRAESPKRSSIRLGRRERRGPRRRPRCRRSAGGGAEGARASGYGSIPSGIDRSFCTDEICNRYILSMVLRSDLYVHLLRCISENVYNYTDIRLLRSLI